MLGMHVEEGPDDYEKKMTKRKEAMKARLEKLSKGNPVVSTSIKRIDQQLNKPDREQWSVVDDLVSSAYGQFCDGDLAFKEAVTSLSNALTELTKSGK